MEKIKFKYEINENPKSKIEHFFLSLQHVFAMFGSTVLVPTLIGLDISTSLFTAGCGTLIYSQMTDKKVPVFIGSSFAYIALLAMLNETMGINGVANAVISAGIIYLVISAIVKLIGVKWLGTILPPVVIGPLIIVIGLSLATVAVSNSGFAQENLSIPNMLISLSTLIITALILLKGNIKIKTIPIISGIISGYIIACFLDPFFSENLVDTTKLFGTGLIGLPNLNIPFVNYDFHFEISIFFMVVPITLVTIAEHIGDHTVSGSIMNKNFLKNPGLHKTLLGDGLATLFAGFVGGPVNTTYAENTGVIMLTKVASVSVIRLAAFLAIILSFIKPLIGFINSIPASVMGGISIVLFGMIAQNGIRILMNSKIDITHSRNMIIMSVILVMGVGNATLSFMIGEINFVFQGMSLAAILGIMLHLILPEKKVSS